MEHNENLDVFNNTLSVNDLQDLINLNNNYNNYLFFQETKVIFPDIKAKELQNILNETLIKENKQEDFNKVLTELYRQKHTTTALIYNQKNIENLSNHSLFNKISIIKQEDNQLDLASIVKPDEQNNTNNIKRYPSTAISLIKEEYITYIDNQNQEQQRLEKRIFYDLKTNKPTYSETFEYNSFATGKYISKVCKVGKSEPENSSKDEEEIGFRYYKNGYDDPEITNNYFTIFKDKEIYSIVEKQNSFKTEVNCLETMQQLTKNQYKVLNDKSIIDHEIEGNDMITLGNLTAIKNEGQNNDKCAIIMPSDIKNTLWNRCENYFNPREFNTYKYEAEVKLKQKSKTQFLKDLKILDENKSFVIVPISLHGHSTVMLIDLQNKEDSQDKKYELHMFDSSSFHTKAENATNYFGTEIGAEIGENSFIKNDESMQINGTCNYWANTFCKVVSSNNNYFDIKEIKKNFTNGTILIEMYSEMNNIFGNEKSQIILSDNKLEINQERDKKIELQMKNTKYMDNIKYLYLSEECYKNKFFNLKQLENFVLINQLNQINDNIKKQIQDIFDKYNNLIKNNIQKLPKPKIELKLSQNSIPSTLQANNVKSNKFIPIIIKQKSFDNLKNNLIKNNNLYKKTVLLYLGHEANNLQFKFTSYLDHKNELDQIKKQLDKDKDSIKQIFGEQYKTLENSIQIKSIDEIMKERCNRIQKLQLNKQEVLNKTKTQKLIQKPHSITQTIKQCYSTCVEKIKELVSSFNKSKKETVKTQQTQIINQSQPVKQQASIIEQPIKLIQPQETSQPTQQQSTKFQHIAKPTQQSTKFEQIAEPQEMTTNIKSDISNTNIGISNPRSSNISIEDLEAHPIVKQHCNEK